MRHVIAAALLAGTFGVSAAHASVLTNGNFEATPFDSGWGTGIGGPTVTAGSGLVSGSTTAAYLRSNNAVYSWVPTLTASTGPKWSFEMLFASEAPGSDAGTATPGTRLLQLSLQHEKELSPAGGNEGQINLIVDSGGSVQVVSGTSTLNTVISGMTLQPTVDANNNNSFDDPGDTKRVYKLVVAGDYTNANSSARFYNISVIDVATGDTLGSSGNRSFYQYTLPGANGNSPGIWSVELVANVSRHTYAIDNVALTSVAVPEPVAAGLLLGGTTLLATRRRRVAEDAK